MAKNTIKAGSLVKILVGNDKGKQGLVKDIDKRKNKVKVEGVAVCIKHCKARREGEVSQKKIIERFIDLSNVVLISTT